MQKRCSGTHDEGMERPPGWYPDPEDGSKLSWWDGAAWRPHPVPTTEITPPASSDEHTPTAAAAAAALVPGAGQPVRLRKRGRQLQLLGLALLALVAVVVGAIIVTRPDRPSLTYNGEAISQPQATLAQAEEALASIVEERNGATNDHTRCYFSLPHDETTDVAEHVRCGPVLFVDGHPDRVYLRFPLEADLGDGEGESDQLRLVASDEPASPDPDRLAGGEVLRRHDEQSPPDGSGGLEVPPPPRADPGLLEVRDLSDLELEEPGPEARIGSYGGSYNLVGKGEPERIGRGDEARRPAEGERFVAVQLDSDVGEVIAASAPEAAIQIGDDTPVPLPADSDTGSGSRGLIISVPEDVDAVDLVVTDKEIEQRLSLLTGEPAADNIAVLRRSNRDQALDASANMAFHASAPGFVPGDFSVAVTVRTVRLLWFFGADGERRPDGRDRAWLVPETSFAWSAGLDAESEVSLDPEFFTLTLPDGTIVEATNLAEPGKVQIVFDVPADFTEGTLTIGGQVLRHTGETWDFGDSKLQTSISIPAG
jgi:hypothetical protein